MAKRDCFKSEIVGFYIHPDYPELGISVRGEVKVLMTGEDITPPVPKGNQYRSVSFNGQSILHHLLVLSCFEDKPTDGQTWLGNHKDGVKYNNHLLNLEWVTYSGNIIHAYATGLRTDNRPMHVKDLRTGEVTWYISLQSAAKAIGCNGGIVHRWLSGKCAAPLQLWYDVKYDGEPWHDLSEKDAGRNPLFTDSILVYTPEGNKLRFESMADAANLVGLKPATLRYRMKHGISVSNGHETVWASEYNGNDISEYEWVRYVSDRTIPRGERKPVPIEVKYPDGRVEVERSVRDFAARLGVTRSALQRSIWKKGGYRDMDISYIGPVDQ